MSIASPPVAVRVFPGHAEQVRQARQWARALALATCATAADDAELVTAELFANAILHTASGTKDGTVTVAIAANGVIHVHDLGMPGKQACPGLPSPRQPQDGLLPESGRGLLLVAALSTGWVHLLASRCPATGPGDATAAGGCCTWSRPQAWLPPEGAVRREDLTIPRLVAAGCQGRVMWRRGPSMLLRAAPWLPAHAAARECLPAAPCLPPGRGREP
jgi:anti-sigma regulatory factor (Ser/Thr protein kinase)